MPTWTGTWEGGRIRLGLGGQEIFVIDRMRHKKRYNIPLRVAGKNEAKAELALFLRDPKEYERNFLRSKRETVAKATEAELIFTQDLIDSFLVFLRGVKLDEAGLPVMKDGKEVLDPHGHCRSKSYRGDAKKYLSVWKGFYGERDIRTVELSEVKTQLAKWRTARKVRITVLKSFVGFLKTERSLLTSQEDPLLDLKTPAARAEKGKRKLLGGSKHYKLEHISKVYRHILWWESPTRPVKRETLQTIRDLIRLCASCGLHVSEVERISRGEGLIERVEGHGEIAGTVSFIHKTRRVHTVSLDELGLAAALRLKAEGCIPAATYIRKMVIRAAKAAGVAPINPGTLRHSFVTAAKKNARLVDPKDGNGGVPLAAIAAVIGDRTETASTFYDDTVVPPMIVLPLKLENPEDTLI